MERSIQGSKFGHPEYLISFNKDILAVFLGGNEKENSQSWKRLTMPHLAAIIRSEIYLAYPEKYKSFLNPDNLTRQALYLIDFINQLTTVLERLSTCGLKIETDRDKNRLVLDNMKDKYPEVNESQLEEGYKLAKFVDLLKRGINFETEYLMNMKERFDSVSFDIKVEYSVYNLSENIIKN